MLSIHASDICDGGLLYTNDMLGSAARQVAASIKMTRSILDVRLAWGRVGPVTGHLIAQTPRPTINQVSLILRLTALPCQAWLELAG
jgi:hypothetical protein